ncbi:hypothetical protein U91I_04053 [alpha proteobacterium U9-1i]|nr:hypothetical protein U91I_04053 [alpha proteobacterium U9-1i]
MVRKQFLIRRARRLLTERGPAEVRLWSILRGDAFAQYAFKRDKVIGPFEVNFACEAAKVVVELCEASAGTFEAERMAFLKSAGWRVVCISQARVMAAPDEVERAVLDALNS